MNAFTTRGALAVLMTATTILVGACGTQAGTRISVDSVLDDLMRPGRILEIRMTDQGSEATVREGRGIRANLVFAGRTTRKPPDTDGVLDRITLIRRGTGNTLNGQEYVRRTGGRSWQAVRLELSTTDEALASSVVTALDAILRGAEGRGSVDGGAMVVRLTPRPGEDDLEFRYQLGRDPLPVEMSVPAAIFPGGGPSVTRISISQCQCTDAIFRPDDRGRSGQREP